MARIKCKYGKYDVDLFKGKDESGNEKYYVTSKSLKKIFETETERLSLVSDFTVLNFSGANYPCCLCKISSPLKTITSVGYAEPHSLSSEFEVNNPAEVAVNRAFTNAIISYFEITDKSIIDFEETEIIPTKESDCIAANTVVPFGKYTNKTILEVYQTVGRGWLDYTKKDKGKIEKYPEFIQAINSFCQSLEEA